MLKTRLIVGTVYLPSGKPAANAKVYATLSRHETDGGFVVPKYVRAVADELGGFELPLWPNERGSGSSSYSISIQASGAEEVRLKAVVPDGEGPVPLETIIDKQPYPPLDAAEIAVRQAQEAAGESVIAAGRSEAAATQTEDDRRQTGEDREAVEEIAGQVVDLGEAVEETRQLRQATGEDRQAVEGLAQTVGQQAQQVADDKSDVEQALEDAQAAAQTATDKAGEAAGSASAALASEQAAANSAAEVSYLRTAVRRALYGDGPYPFLDVDFCAPELPAIVTHSRASNSCLYDEFGRIITEGPNEWGLDHFPGTGVPRGRQRFRQVTNYCPWSDGSLSRYGTKSNVVDAAIPIAGFENSIEFGDNSVQRSCYDRNAPASTMLTVSFFVEMDDGGMPKVGPDATDDFDIIVGNGTGSVVRFEKCLERVWRVFGTRSSSASNGSPSGPVKRTSHSPRGFRITGMNVVNSETVTPYIPTNGSQVTRAADVASIGSVDGPAFWPGAEGSLVFDCEVAEGEVPGTTRHFTLRAGNTERHMLYSSNVLRSFDASGSNGSNLSGAGWNTGRTRASTSFSQNRRALSKNGGAVLSNPTNADVLDVNNIILSRGVGSGEFNGWLRSIQLYPHSATDAQLQQRSQI